MCRPRTNSVHERFAGPVALMPLPHGQYHVSVVDWVVALLSRLFKAVFKSLTVGSEKFSLFGLPGWKPKRIPCSNH